MSYIRRPKQLRCGFDSFSATSATTLGNRSGLAAIIVVTIALITTALNFSCAASNKRQRATLTDANSAPATDITDMNDASTTPPDDRITVLEEMQVVITASDPVICRGECATLTAQAKGGLAPYRYTWNPNIGQGVGPHQVCPTQTSLYDVVVSDVLATSQEFATQPVTTTIEIVVEVCPDTGTSLANAGTEGTEEVDSSTVAPKAGTVEPREIKEACRAHAALTPDDVARSDEPTYADYLARYVSPSMLTTDDQNNFILAIDFDGILDVEGEVFDGNDGYLSLLISKYDTNCQRQWSKSFSAPSAWVEGASIAASGSDLVLAGSFNGAVDFGQGILVSRLYNSAILVKLDAQGNTLWAQIFTASPQNAFLKDVTVDSQGEIVVTGMFNGMGTLGGETLGRDFVTAITFFVAKLSPTGEYIWSKELPDANGYPFVANTKDRVIAMTYPSVEGTVVATLDEYGDEIWRFLDQRNPDPSDPVIAALDANRSGVVGWIVQPVEEVPSIDLYQIDIDTYLESSLMFDRPNQDFDWYLSAVDGLGYTLETGMFTEILDATSLQAVGSRDAFLLQHDDDGRVVGYAIFGTSSYDRPVGLAVDSNNNPIMAVITNKGKAVEDLTIIRYKP